MKTLESLLESYNIFEKRSALYYLGRYIKQAEIFENYEKNIFIDGAESNPDEKIKSLTLNMIEHIERAANKKASEFNEDEFYYWMDYIAEIEDNIDNVPNQEIIEKALEELDKFEVPKSKEN
ncbi:hypothetical protein [Pedobacter metabolipauper]|uniref:Uncharacterized protein n=1 Tax=Pedobacter metabolipauper TaxID=425513 RepID=A0A4R6SRK6_9SPHI|nr:hypothetical protein [Pedobacter metabolipauper]TDQ06252.1 hypothetical protein ATK78_4633 [Pedobacter metabolipauper]